MLVAPLLTDACYTMKAACVLADPGRLCGIHVLPPMKVIAHCVQCYNPLPSRRRRAHTDSGCRNPSAVFSARTKHRHASCGLGWRRSPLHVAAAMASLTGGDMPVGVCSSAGCGPAGDCWRAAVPARHRFPADRCKLCALLHQTAHDDILIVNACFPSVYSSPVHGDVHQV